eukprot:1810789-Rhodomonas_salina.2
MDVVLPKTEEATAKKKGRNRCWKWKHRQQKWRPCQHRLRCALQYDTEVNDGEKKKHSRARMGTPPL